LKLTEDLKSAARYAHLVGLFSEMQQRRLDSYYYGEILSDRELPINNLEKGPSGGARQGKRREEPMF